jgi:hypothetical protein
MENLSESLSEIDITPCYEHACLLSSVWSSAWPQIAIKSGYSIDQILSRLETRSISWWINAIKKMPIAFYVKNNVTGATGFSYLMHDTDIMLLAGKNFSNKEKEENDKLLNVYSFIEKEAWGTDLSKQLGKALVKKTLEKNIYVFGGWVMKTNGRSSAAAEKGNWKLVKDSASPIWEPNIDFKYFMFDNTDYAIRNELLKNESN